MKRLKNINKKSLSEIIGSWKGNKLGYDYYVTISDLKVKYKRYYDYGMVDSLAGELKDLGSYDLKYSSKYGWYYTRFDKELTISKTKNTLKFQFYDVLKQTINMH